jgi:hypothetical protein
MLRFPALTDRHRQGASSPGRTANQARSR